MHPCLPSVFTVLAQILFYNLGCIDVLQQNENITITILRCAWRVRRYDMIKPSALMNRFHD